LKYYQSIKNSSKRKAFQLSFTEDITNKQICSEVKQVFQLLSLFPLWMEADCFGDTIYKLMLCGTKIKTDPS
jgi:hypothetical protein